MLVTNVSHSQLWYLRSHMIYMTAPVLQPTSPLRGPSPTSMWTAEPWCITKYRRQGPLATSTGSVRFLLCFRPFAWIAACCCAYEFLQVGGIGCTLLIPCMAAASHATAVSLSPLTLLAHMPTKEYELHPREGH